MEITERVAYLKGLAEGMELNTDKREGKVLAAMIDVLEDIALELEDIQDEQAELADGLDAVSDDLEDVEDVVFNEYDEEDDDEDCYATTCPTCEETIYFDESILEDGEVICPNCGEKHYIFGKSNLEQVAAELQVKVLAQIPMDPAMAAAMDQGAMETMEHNYLEPVADAILAHEQG